MGIQEAVADKLIWVGRRKRGETSIDNNEILFSRCRQWVCSHHFNNIIHHYSWGRFLFQTNKKKKKLLGPESGMVRPETDSPSKDQFIGHFLFLSTGISIGPAFFCLLYHTTLLWHWVYLFLAGHVSFSRKKLDSAVLHLRNEQSEKIPWIHNEVIAGRS